MGRMVERPQEGGRRFLQLKDNDKKKVRFVFDGPWKNKDEAVVNGTQQMMGSWWHKIDEDAKIGRKYHDWLCIGQFRNCPLCLQNSRYEEEQKAAGVQKVENKNKPYPLRKKTYVNAWSYDEQRMVIVSLGNDLIKKVQTIEETMGDCDKYDMMLTRKGTGLMTTYDAIPLPGGPEFVLPGGTFLYDLEADVASSERSQEDLDEVISGEFDRKRAANNAEAQSTGNSGASSVMVTFGIHAGKTLGQIQQTHPDYVVWLAGNSHDPNIAQAASFLVKQAASQAPAPQAPAQPAAPAPAPAPQAPAPAVPVAGSPFEALAAQAAAPTETTEDVRKRVINLAMTKAELKDPQKLAALMKQAGGGMDINKFTIEQLRSLEALMNA